MLKVIAEDFIKPEAVETVLPLYRELVDKTRQEDLCISYDLFIDQKVDGFYAETPEELADFINFLFRNEPQRAAMALAARRKAMDVFNHDRYLLAWTELLKNAVG